MHSNNNNRVHVHHHVARMALHRMNDTNNNKLEIDDNNANDAITSTSSSTSKDCNKNNPVAYVWSLWSSSIASSISSTALAAALLLTTTAATTLTLLPNAALAENELSVKYGSAGFDTSLVDQTCLVDQCSVQAKACLADDPNCRKGLTCTAKCMGDNACITGCMARYGNSNLDHLLKCTIEDHECIKVAILPGGADRFEDAPKPPAPTVANFQMESMTGAWYKVVGYNPNYDCYACQRNTFHMPDGDSSNSNSNSNWMQLQQNNDQLEMDVEFSMPHLLPDGSPPPPSGMRETLVSSDSGNGQILKGSKSIGFNEYATHEVMVFDNHKGVGNTNDSGTQKNSGLVLGKGTDNEQAYARTAHSEGEMFGLKFWENWYIIGENDPGQDDFKFVYYNGKTRQNTYEGAFVYSRTKELTPANMEKVYAIADAAGLQPDNFCRIQNGCFKDSKVNVKKQGADYPFRGILASTKVSEFFGVQPVIAEGDGSVLKRAELDKAQSLSASEERAWWYKVGDYLENPHRHFKAMESQRQVMDWPDDIKERVTANKYDFAR